MELYLNLEELNVSSNMISQIGDLSHLRLLTKLNLSENCLKDASGLAVLISLNYLNLSNNLISTVPDVTIDSG